MLPFRASCKSVAWFCAYSLETEALLICLVGTSIIRGAVHSFITELLRSALQLQQHGALITLTVAANFSDASLSPHWHYRGCVWVCSVCVCVCVVDIRGVEISRYTRYTYRDPYVEDSALTQRRSINEILQLVWSHALTWKQTKRYFRM